MDSIPMIIAKIDYDLFGMPVRIQFTNGHVTEHVYTSEGEKLKTIHRTAVPNISISLNSTLTLNGTNTLSVDSTDYLGSFVFEQGGLNKEDRRDGSGEHFGGSAGRLFDLKVQSGRAERR